MLKLYVQDNSVYGMIVVVATSMVDAMVLMSKTTIMIPVIVLKNTKSKMVCALLILEIVK